MWAVRLFYFCCVDAQIPPIMILLAASSAVQMLRFHLVNVRLRRDWELSATLGERIPVTCSSNVLTRVVIVPAAAAGGGWRPAVQQRGGGLSGRHPTPYRGVMGPTAPRRNIFHHAASRGSRFAWWPFYPATHLGGQGKPRCLLPY
jgi:hypothetical protein